MKWELRGDWPIKGGTLVIPAGEILHGSADGTVRWKDIVVPTPLPMEAKALTPEAADLLLHWHGHHHRHLLHFGGHEPRPRVHMHTPAHATAWEAHRASLAQMKAQWRGRK
jgi:hypothetical protein